METSKTSNYSPPHCISVKTKQWTIERDGCMKNSSRSQGKGEKVEGKESRESKPLMSKTFLLSVGA